MDKFSHINESMNDEDEKIEHRMSPADSESMQHEEFYTKRDSRFASDSDSVHFATKPYKDQGRKGTQRLLRWPLLIIIWSVIIGEFALYLILRLVVLMYELILFLFDFVICGRKIRELRSRLHAAKSFEEWHDAVTKLDHLERLDEWKKVDESPYYDYENVRSILSKLRAYLAADDFENVMNLLSDVYTRNVAHNTIDNVLLYSESYFGTKYLIGDFVKEVLAATKKILESSKISKDIKLSFFKRAKRAYGRTALCLSGGATMTFFHFGVIKALLDTGSLPNIISGASGGSLVGALIGVRTNEELADFINPKLAEYLKPCKSSWADRINRLFQTGAIFDQMEWRDLLRVACMGDMTFEQAYKRTGKILNIAITSQHKHSQSIVLNYVSAPHIVIWSAVIASSAIPMIITPAKLFRRLDDGTLIPYRNFGPSFSDGSIKADLPMKQLSEYFNCNHFLVSQTNPHVLPFMFYNRGETGQPNRFTTSQFRGGFISALLEAALRLEMRKWLQVLGELDLLPEFFHQDWRHVLLQATSGDVTILARPRLRDYLCLIEDPTPEDMAYFILSGQQSTWPCLCKLSNHYVFEKTLSECIDSLEAPADRVNAIGVPVDVNLNPIDQSRFIK